MESATLILFCLTLKFIDKSTVKAWIQRTIASQHWQRYLCYLYIFTLWMYLLRNLALLFYDMATHAKKIDRHASRKQIDNLLYIADVTARASFVQFFYAAIFRNPKLSAVCKEQTPSRDQLFPILTEESADLVQPLIVWEPYIK